MSDPIDVGRAILADPTDLAHVRELATTEARYVSLNDGNPQLHAVIP